MTDTLQHTGHSEPPFRQMQLLRDGDPEALRALYRQHATAALAVARKVLGNPSLAEEAVQHAFLSLWKSRDRIDPSRDPAPWVFSFVKRAAIDMLRREKLRTHSSIDSSEQHPALRDDGDDPMRAWETWQVRKAVDALPTDEREVVRLSHFDGYTHGEIAERLGVAVGTVKSRSFRAHQRLATALRSVREVS